MTQLRTDSTQTQNIDGVKSENQNRPQGHTHKTTKRLQTNYKTKQTQNLKRVKKNEHEQTWKHLVCVSGGSGSDVGGF